MEATPNSFYVMVVPTARARREKRNSTAFIADLGRCTNMTDLVSTQSFRLAAPVRL
jgi:hypothetical protein